MAGKKDKVVVAVISDLTENQAADICKHIVVAKSKYAEHARGTIATGTREDVGILIQRGVRRPRIAKKTQGN